MTDPVDEVLLARVRSAQAVALGRVREVRQLTGSEAQSGKTGHVQVSEHDPAMAEAVIEVSEGIKGTQAGQEVVVRFPTSTDVLWYRYPKFKAGSSGVFILSPDTLARGAAVLDKSSETFNVRRADDVLPVTDAERVRAAVKQSRPKN
jgi:hypothetical protein